MKRLLLPAFVMAALSASAAGPYDSIVAADGTGDFRTVSDAIAAAPEGSTRPWKILVKNGDYDELIEIPETKPNIHLIGQDRGRTVIHHLVNQGGKAQENSRFDKTIYWQSSVHNPESSTYGKGPAVVMVKAPGFYAEDITFTNDWGVDATSGPQALAMHTNADRSALNGCVLRGFQDTWRTANEDTCRTYARDCRIEGAVDYMYGGGDALVENSVFYNVRGGSVIVAPSHGPDVKWGYVLDGCTVDGNAEAADGKLKLGRPWKGAPKVLWLNTTLLIPILPEGWGDMGTIPAMMADRGTRDRLGNPDDTSARKTLYKVRDRKTGEVTEGTARASVTDAEAARYTYDAIIRPAEGWDPAAMMTRLPAPTELKYEDGTLSWQPVEGAAGYIVYDGDHIITATEATSLSVPQIKTSLKVRAVNPWGAKGKQTFN